MIMKKTVFFCIFLISASSSFSQTEKLIVPSDLKQQTIVTEPVTLRKGYFRVGFLIDYRVADRYFDNSGTREYYRASSWGSKSAYGLMLQYGISNRLQVDLVSEYMYRRQETRNTEIIALTSAKVVTSVKRRGLGIGDSRVSISYQLIAEKENKLSLTGNIQATIPTGEKNPSNIKNENEYDLPVGDGTFALGLNVFARKIVFPYSFSGYVAYTNNFSGTKVFKTLADSEKKFKMGNLFETGLSGNLHLNEWIVFGNEINFYTEHKGEIEGFESELLPASWAISYEPGLVFQVHRFRLSETIRIPVKGKNVPADPLYVVMAQYIF